MAVLSSLISGHKCNEMKDEPAVEYLLERVMYRGRTLEWFSLDVLGPV